MEKELIYGSDCAVMLREPGHIKRNTQKCIKNWCHCNIQVDQVRVGPVICQMWEFTWFQQVGELFSIWHYWARQRRCWNLLRETAQSKSVEVLDGSSLISSRKPCLSLGGRYSLTASVGVTGLQAAESLSFYQLFITSLSLLPLSLSQVSVAIMPSSLFYTFH